MKVAMLGWEFPPFISGGLGAHCLGLTRALARRGVAIDFYMPRTTVGSAGARVADHHDHLRIVEVDAEPGVGPYASGRGVYPADFNRAVSTYNARLVDRFDSRDADLLHCHDWITVPAGLELQEATGIPLVFTVHSTEYDRSAGFAPQTWIEEIERRGVNEAARVIAVSRYTKGLVQRNYGVEPRRVVAVANGVDATRFPSGRRRDYTSGDGAVLFLSRITAQKGPLDFLRAAKRVLEVRPSARFLMAGQGDQLGPCIEFALEHGLGERVRFVGFVPDQELAALYADSQIYVLPSISEPFGISVLEAMASGLPTVVSRASGVGEHVAHALKVAPRDVEELAGLVVALLDSAPLREEMGRNGSTETRAFTWARCASRTLAVYRHAAAAKVARAGAAT